MKKLHKVTAQLRDPDSGCPWDREQSFESIADCTIEEAYEVVEAINEKDYESLKYELGDLLFQVSFHSLLAEEKGLFTLDDVIDGITKKLISRHPHVFSNESIDGSITQTDQWEKIKVKEQREKSKNSSLMDGIGKNQPPLNQSFKIGKKARAVGFDWPDIDGVYKKLDEEIEELKLAVESDNEEEISNELGDLFFTMVSIARHLKINPESSIRNANKKFIDRFRIMEDIIKSQEREFEDVDLEELENLWESAKEIYQSEK
mgnify:FL=1